MKIPTPSELGLPEKFENWRPVQEEALRVIITSKKRAPAACQPTGSGKSAVNVGLAVMSKKSTCIVTYSRGLMNQMMDDFPDMITCLFGRDNYPCIFRDEYSCEKGYAASCPFRGTPQCPSSQAEMRAACSPIVVTNYAKWIAARLYGQGMDHFEQVIFDEAHYAPEALANAMQTILHHKEIEERLSVDFPTIERDSMLTWKLWAIRVKKEAEYEMQLAQEKIRNNPNARATWIHDFTHLRNLVRRLTIIATASPQNWVVDEIKGGFQFDPIRPGRYAEGMLLLRMERIIAVSATIRPKTLNMIGLGKDSFDFWEFPSDFDPKDSPIYYVPTQRVDSKHPDNSFLWILHDQIASKHREVKGITHTVSFARRDEVMGHSRFSGSMIVNEKGNPPTEVIEQFYAAGPGTILVSPSVGTGYDFPGQYCEWQFLAKIPFEPPSKIVKARDADDPEYRGYKAMQTMEQTFGRGNRFKGDRCSNFMGDDNLKWFLPRFVHLASNNFQKRFKAVAILPPALPKM